WPGVAPTLRASESSETPRSRRAASSRRPMWRSISLTEFISASLAHGPWVECRNDRSRIINIKRGRWLRLYLSAGRLSITGAKQLNVRHLPLERNQFTTQRVSRAMDVRTMPPADSLRRKKPREDIRFAGLLTF